MIGKLISKYKAVPINTKAALWFMVCSVIQNGARFLAMPFLVRIMTSEQYGIYCVFISWISIVSIFATLKLDCGVMNNAMLRYPNSRDEYTSSAQSLSITTAVICLIIYMLFSSAFDRLFGLSADLSVMIFIQLLFTEGYLLWSTHQRYEYKYVPLLASTIVFSALYTLLPITAGIFVPSDKRLKAVIYSGVAVQSFFGLFFIIKNYVKNKCGFKKEYWKYALSFNIPLIPHYLSGIILGQADRVMIRKMVGASEAGIYSFVYNISLAMNIITTSINNAIIPYTYEKLKKRDFKNLRIITNFILIVIAVLTLMFSLVAPELIKILATEEYYSAMYIVPVIALSSFFQFLYCLYGNIEFFFEKNKFITVASVIGAFANIVLNALLIPRFGYFAAGYTTFFCYLLFSLCHYIFSRIICKAKLDNERVYDNKAIFIISLTVIVASFALIAIYDYWYIRYALLAAFGVILIVKRKAIINNLKIITEKRQM